MGSLFCERTHVSRPLAGFGLCCCDRFQAVVWRERVARGGAIDEIHPARTSQLFGMDVVVQNDVQDFSRKDRLVSQRFWTGQLLRQDGEQIVKRLQFWKFFRSRFFL